MGFHCPSCGREVYIRRRKRCEFCGAEMPLSLRLSASQLAYILRLKSDEARRGQEPAEPEPHATPVNPDLGSSVQETAPC